MDMDFRRIGAYGTAGPSRLLMVEAGVDLQRGDSINALDQNTGSLPRAGTVKTEND